MGLKELFNNLSQKSNPTKWCKKHQIKLGKDVRFTGPMDFGSEPYLIEIGNHVTIAGATFITHEGGHWVIKGLKDYDGKDCFGYGRIIIKDNVFIGRNTTILRGVNIGENVIVGACSLVNKSLEPNAVYAGVPAKRICSIEEFKTKFLGEMPEYDEINYRKNKKDEILKIVDKFPKR